MRPSRDARPMETTRHFTATVYVVHDGATVLHRHPKLDIWLPPGGHLNRDELPHETATREVREETGLDVTLVADREDVPTAGTVRMLPEPQHFQLADIDVRDGDVFHQHVDMVYYAAADGRDLSPADGEPDADSWAWFTAADLRDDGRFDPDVAAIGRRAIEIVDEQRG